MQYIRYRLLEASYDGMISSMKEKYPEQSTFINSNLNWARTSLKKADRIIWYMKIVKAKIDNNLPAVIGNYPFRTFQSFQNDLEHFYGMQSTKIQNYQFQNQNIGQVMGDFVNFEREFQASDKAPVKVQTGDKEIIKFPDGSGWWFLDRAFCPDEGRSGGHCGNIDGHRNPDQRILSYRKNSQVILTFILHSDGNLGEMKGRSNTKPSTQYHQQIMSLLLNPLIKGINGGGYKPENNFEITDLSKENYKILQDKKPELVQSALKSKEMRELSKYPERILDYDQDSFSLAQMKNFLNGKFDNMEYVDHEYLHYEELVKWFIDLDIDMLYYIPPENITKEIADYAIGSDSGNVFYIPKDKITFDQWLKAVQDNEGLIDDAPEIFKDELKSRLGISEEISRIKKLAGI
jgi:hypothetical protein